MMTGMQSGMLKVAAVLWMVWGLVHAFAGILTLSASTVEAFRSIADGVDPQLIVGPFHAAVGAVQDQHSWNLLWFGVVTMIGSVFVWRANMTAIWVTAMVGGLADIGYFVFLDLPGHVNFFPGTLMTIVSGSAILLSGYVWLSQRNKS